MNQYKSVNEIFKDFHMGKPLHPIEFNITCRKVEEVYINEPYPILQDDGIYNQKYAYRELPIDI